MSRDDNLAEVRHMAERMAEGMARAGEQIREIAQGLTRNLPHPEPTEPHGPITIKVSEPDLRARLDEVNAHILSCCADTDSGCERRPERDEILWLLGERDSSACTCDGCTGDTNTSGHPGHYECDDSDCPQCTSSQPEPIDERRPECHDCRPINVGCAEACWETDPVDDPVGTVRVHSNDDPADPNARRVWKVNGSEPWYGPSVGWCGNDDLDCWYRQPLADVACVFAHPGGGLQQVAQMYAQKYADAVQRAKKAEADADACLIEYEKKEAVAERLQRDWETSLGRAESAEARIARIRHAFNRAEWGTVEQILNEDADPPATDDTVVILRQRGTPGCDAQIERLEDVMRRVLDEHDDCDDPALHLATAAIGALRKEATR